MTKECPFCHSSNVSTNKSRTLHCMSCRYGVMRSGNVFRLAGHPMFNKWGWKILPKHEDYSLQKRTIKVKKPRILIPRRKDSWARNA